MDGDDGDDVMVGDAISADDAYGTGDDVMDAVWQRDPVW